MQCGFQKLLPLQIVPTPEEICLFGEVAAPFLASFFLSSSIATLKRAGGIGGDPGWQIDSTIDSTGEPSPSGPFTTTY